MDPSESDCGVPNACARTVPSWLVLLDNAPTGLMFLLGAAILWPVGEAWALAYLAYSALSIVLFWMRICPSCHHHGTRACPCGYGALSARWFPARRGGRSRFRAVFRRNILLVLPSWFVPLGVDACRLWRGFPSTGLWLLVAFCVVGFVCTPLVSRFAGCRSCALRKECQWMSRAATDHDLRRHGHDLSR